MAGPTSLRIPIDECRRVRLSFPARRQMCWSAAIEVAKRLLTPISPGSHLTFVAISQTVAIRIEN